MDALREAGCEKIFTDRMTGSRLDRPGWDQMMAYVRPGDTFPGRAAGYPTAPPQTRTSAINASGSSDSRFCYVDGVDHPDRGEWIATQEVLESHPRHGGTPGPATEPLLPDFLDRFDELL
jgi:hypothetical protein